MSKECLGRNFQIPRKHICHDDFNKVLTNFNGQGENIVNNSDFIDTNVNSPNNNLNKTLDNSQRVSEIKDMTEKSKSDLLGLIKYSGKKTQIIQTLLILILIVSEKKL